MLRLRQYRLPPDPSRRRAARRAAAARPAGKAGRAGRRSRRGDAAAGLAEVLAIQAIWRDAAGRLAELPGPGSGIVACGALPGAVAPVPAWTAGELAAAGVAAEPGRVPGSARGWGW